jgi:hypothetical protein
MPLLVYPSGTNRGSDGFIVAPYVLYRDNAYLYVGNTGTPPVLAHKPADGTATMGLVFLDTDTGNPGILINSGTPMDVNFNKLYEVLPYIPIPGLNQEPLYGFKLTSGTSSVGWDNLFNIRQFIGGFTDLTVLDHNLLAGLQGGETSNYYHLTQSQHDGLIGETITNLHTHSADHVHGISRWSGVSGQTTFEYPDVVSFVESAKINGLAEDGLSYSLSSDGTQLILNSALPYPAEVSSEYLLETL